MTKAPKKIWACVPANGKRRKEAVYGWTTKHGLKAWVEDGDEDDFGSKLDYVEYIRLDLHEAAVTAALAAGMRAMAIIAEDVIESQNWTRGGVTDAAMEDMLGRIKASTPEDAK